MTAAKSTTTTQRNDLQLTEYAICRVGYGDMLLGDPLLLSPEEACRRDPAKFVKLVIEVNKVWRAYYQEQMARRVQVVMPLAESDSEHDLASQE